MNPTVARMLVLALLAMPSLVGCSDRANGTPAAGSRPAPAVPPVPVVVADVVQRDVPVQVAAVGNVQAFTMVSVKSQLSGQVMRVHFREGQDVAENDLLFTIDPRPLEAALRQAQANVARDRAQLQQAEAALAQRRAEVQQAEANLTRDVAQMDNARVQEGRYRDLVTKELIAREQYDQVRTNAAAMDATVAADRAAIANAKASEQAAIATVDNVKAVIAADDAVVDNARLQLAYTTIRAPMSGRTGNIIVQPGNVVKANEDPALVSISQVHPIYVSFAVPERYLDEIRRRGGALAGLRVEAYPDRTKTPAAGQVTFVNSTVDATTGTIQLKATFQNADNALWPGQFVDVVLVLSIEANAIVVPTQAVQPGQSGTFVFVVKPDSTVESRPVSVGRQLERETIVTKGLTRGERVVTDGQLRLVPGARVEIKSGKAS